MNLGGNAHKAPCVTLLWWNAMKEQVADGMNARPGTRKGAQVQAEN